VCGSATVTMVSPSTTMSWAVAMTASARAQPPRPPPSRPGLIVATNISLTLAAVPPADNGSASGVLNTAQRLGSAVGSALVGTVLFPSLSVYGTGPHAVAVGFSHALADALLVNLALIAATMTLAIVSPGGRRGSGVSAR
jgi:hypothetical protein